MTQKTNQNPWQFDVRVRERNLKQGSLTDKELEKHLAGLPDLEAQTESFGTSQPALEQPRIAPAPAPVVASALESDDDLDDEDDEDEDDDLDEAPAVAVAVAAPEPVAAAPVAEEPAAAPAPAAEGTEGASES